MQYHRSRLVFLFIMAMSLIGCDSDNDGVVISDPAFQTTYIVINNTNYDLSVEPVLYYDELYNDAYLGDIDSGMQKSIYHFTYMGSSAIPPSNTFSSLSFSTDLGSGMEVVYSIIDNESWVVESSGENRHSNYVLYLTDSDLSF